MEREKELTAIAHEIRKTVELLNEKVREAEEKGLRVEIETHTSTMEKRPITASIYLVTDY